MCFLMMPEFNAHFGLCLSIYLDSLFHQDQTCWTEIDSRRITDLNILRYPLLLNKHRYFEFSQIFEVIECKKMFGLKAFAVFGKSNLADFNISTRRPQRSLSNRVGFDFGTSFLLLWSSIG